MSAETELFYPDTEIVGSTAQEMEAILSSLQDLIRTKGQASMADLMMLVGLHSRLRHSHYKWGWDNARAFAYKRSHSRYILLYTDPKLFDFVDAVPYNEGTN